MFGRRKQTSTRIDTLLGRTANLNGDLEFSGGLHLDGRVNGNVRSNAEDGGALSVSESGFIEGSVEVTNIVMNGTVNGDMYARERLVLGGSVILGNLDWVTEARRAVSERALEPARGCVDVVVAELGDEGGLLGAALLFDLHEQPRLPT
jgi:hypothetical protein